MEDAQNTLSPQGDPDLREQRGRCPSLSRQSCRYRLRLVPFQDRGEIADTYGDRIAAGSKAVVKIGNDKLDGVVSDVTPLSKNGVISFTVQLEEDNHRRLRSGLKTDVYVMNAVKDDVMRIHNASFYVGKGEYELFVVNGDQLIKRKGTAGRQQL